MVGHLLGQNMMWEENQYLLGAYHVPSIAQGTRDMMANKYLTTRSLDVQPEGRSCKGNHQEGGKADRALRETLRQVIKYFQLTLQRA